MNPTIAFEIVELALSLVKTPGTDKAGALVQIVGKALRAYQDQTGAPLDPSVIRPESLE